MKYQYMERRIMLMRPVVKVRKRRTGRIFWRRGVRPTAVVVACFVCGLPMALVLIIVVVWVVCARAAEETEE